MRRAVFQCKGAGALKGLTLDEGAYPMQPLQAGAPWVCAVGASYLVSVLFRGRTPSAP